MVYDQEDTPLLGVGHERGTGWRQPTRYELGRKAARLIAAIIIAAAVIVAGSVIGWLAWAMATGVQG